MLGRMDELVAADGHGNYALMCGRYASFLPAEAIARIFGTKNRCRTWRRRGTSHQLTTAPWSDAILRPTSVTSICWHGACCPIGARRPINARSEGAAGASDSRLANARQRQD
jgi:hypothetical protein